MSSLAITRVSFPAAVFLIVSCFTHVAGAVDIVFTDSGGHAFTQEERNLITEIAEATETEVRALLPGIPSHLTVDVTIGRFVIEETGELGGAVAPGRVQWTVDASRKGGVQSIANAHLRATLFHEFHHLARGWVMSGGAPRQSFMDAVVSEGMATVFARDFADANPLWTHYPDHVVDWVEELKALPNNAPYHIWMFQHTDGRKWIGYKAGVYLVDQAMTVSGKTSVDLVNTPTAEVLRLVGEQ